MGEKLTKEQRALINQLAYIDYELFKLKVEIYNLRKKFSKLDPFDDEIDMDMLMLDLELSRNRLSVKELLELRAQAQKKMDEYKASKLWRVKLEISRLKREIDWLQKEYSIACMFKNQADWIKYLEEKLKIKISKLAELEELQFQLENDLQGPEL